LFIGWHGREKVYVLSLVVWDGVVGERGWVYIFSPFLLSKYGDLMKKKNSRKNFIKITIIIYLGYLLVHH
jgi:hypothetical protein